MAEAAADPTPDQILSGVYGARITYSPPLKPGDRQLSISSAIEEAL